MQKRQGSFIGGLDQVSPVTDIPDDAYELLINARVRHGDVEPIKKHVELTNAPAGIKQGLVAVGDTLILFVAGSAYYQVDGTSTWTQIVEFHMSPTVYRYWIQPVPASSMNFKRKAAGAASTVVAKANFKIAGTPQCLVVQDGTNQPFLIIFDTENQEFTSRSAKTYADWNNTGDTLDGREYVPVGREMMILENILYIVAPDRKNVYRSITGRPLDFMINVDVNGAKMPTEAEGGATSMSFSFDFEEITCLQPVNIPSSFVYATANTTRILTANYDLGIFGEPAYIVSAQIEAGIVNQESFLEIIGDYALIDFEGVKSFNAVQQLKVEGNVDIFSQHLSKMLKNISQVNCACTKLDNYGIFNLDTVFGNVLVVYDMLRNKWVSVDITPALKIKMFAITKTSSTFKLYAISFDDHVYHMYGDEDTVFTSQIYTKTYQPDAIKSEHKSEMFKPLFTKGTMDGTAQLTEYVDGKKSADHKEISLTTSVGPVRYPVRCPVRQDYISNVDNPGFQLKNGLKGAQIQYVLQWDTDHQLSQFELETKEDTSITSLKQKASI